MIKAKRGYDLSTGEHYLSTKVICRTNRVTKWYAISKHTDTTWYWNNPSEPTIGPTCLSAWSK